MAVVQTGPQLFCQNLSGKIFTCVDSRRKGLSLEESSIRVAVPQLFLTLIGDNCNLFPGGLSAWFASFNMWAEQADRPPIKGIDCNYRSISAVEIKED